MEPAPTGGPQEAPSDDRAIERLQTALRDRDVARSQDALRALACPGPSAPAIVRGLVMALVDADSLVRRRAAGALGQFDSTTATDALGRALADPSWPVREAAVQALGQVGNAPGAAAVIRPPLVDAALHDPNQLVRAAACLALAQLPGQASVAVAALQRALQQERPRVKRRAARALASFPDEADAIVPMLGHALTNSHARVRQSVVEALGNLGAPAAAVLPALIRRLYDGDGRVRGAADGVVRALLRMLPSALGSLLKPLLDPRQSAEDDLNKLLEGGTLPRPVSEEFVQTCGRRANWYRRLSRVPEERTADVATPAEAAHVTVAAAEGAAARQVPPSERPEAAVAAARATESAWQVACLCRLLCGYSRAETLASWRAP